MGTHKFDAVVIGGGIVGVSMAYWLSKLGVRSVAMIEREAGLAFHSTGKCAGGIRAQFSAEINIRIQIEAVRFYENFQKEIGGEPEFIQSGYLFLIGTEKLQQDFERNVAVQRRLGLPVEILSPDQIREIAPYVNTDQVRMGTFCRTDGYADPHGVVQALWNRCREMGVQGFFETEVTALQTEAGKVVCAQTSRGAFQADIFVNGAGAWSGEVAKMAGAEVPVYPLRRMLFFTNEIPPSSTLPAVIPLTIDMDTGFYMRRESGGLVLGMEDDNEVPGFHQTLNWDWLPVLLEAGMRRVPLLETAEIKTGWAGLYDQSPDHSAVLGLIPGFRNFYIVSGFSGHGFMQAPIATKLVAEQVVLGSPSIDISPLRVERFRDQQPVHETNVI